MDAVLEQLYITLQQRQGQDPTTSYTASLFHKGLDHILKKVIEESGEVLIAAKNQASSTDSKALCYELADLYYHCLVLMVAQGVSPAQVAAELSRRMGVSGLAEKASRPQ